VSIIASPSVLGEDIMFFYLSFKLSRYYYAKSQMKVSSKFEKKNQYGFLIFNIIGLVHFFKKIVNLKNRSEFYTYRYNNVKSTQVESTISWQKTHFYF